MMSIIFPLAIAMLGAASIFLIAISMIPSTNVLRKRISKLERAGEQMIPQHQLLMEQIVSPERKTTLRNRLDEAGWYEVSPGALALRGVGAFGIGLSIGILLVIFSHNGTLAIVIGSLIALIGWRVPSILLARAIKQRKELIARDLPEFLDLLSTSVQAGLAINAALVQSVGATTGPLHAELTSTLAEIRLGRSRAEALNAMADRANESSLTMAVSSIVQAEKLGSDLAAVLQELSKDARDQRWMQAEEKAAQLPIKMIIPMVFFMIPSLYLMIFGPVIASFIAKQGR